MSSATVGGSASRSSLITPGRLQPGTFGACLSLSLSGSNTPGPPTTVCATCFQVNPAASTTSCATAATDLTSALPLRARLRSSRRATISPERSAAATRIHARPMSMPTT